MEYYGEKCPKVKRCGARSCVIDTNYSRINDSRLENNNNSDRRNVSQAYGVSIYFYLFFFPVSSRFHSNSFESKNPLLVVSFLTLFILSMRYSTWHFMYHLIVESDMQLLNCWNSMLLGNSPGASNGLTRKGNIKRKMNWINYNNAIKMKFEIVTATHSFVCLSLSSSSPLIPATLAVCVVSYSSI